MTPSDASDITRLSARNFSRLSAFIADQLGIKMPDAKVPMVQSRLMRRARELGFDSVDGYVEHVFQAPGASGERVHVIDALTTNKTDFFREPVHFDYLTASVLPMFRAEAEAGRGNRGLRLWSAGCSSGEEPYTLTMVLSEFASRNRGFDFSILATDVSTRMLERAKAAIYEESRIAPVPASLRSKYLLRSKDPVRQLVRVVPDLRRTVTFEHLNLMDETYRVRGPFDVVFFRNVMIYFDRPTQEKVVNRMCRHIQSGGYLFVGHSETLAGLDIPVAAVGPAIYRRT